MADEENSAITFETFRKFQRKEKKNEKLQELPEEFFKTCVEWINRKQERFEENNDTTLLKEIENVKNIVSDIFERRRKKILLLALHSVRSKKVSKNLLPEEEEFFESTVENLRNLEENLLERVLVGEKPKKGLKEDEGEGGTEEEEEECEDEKEVEEEGKEGEGEEAEEGQTEEKGQKTKKEEVQEENETVETRSLGSDDSEDRRQDKSEEVDVKSADGQKLLKVTDKIERFVATDDNEYGPLEEGDLVTLPKDVANLLIEKEKAKESEI